MRKNGSRFISLKQYRATDLFLFAVILIAFELLVHFAFIGLKGSFTFSPMLPITLLVIMRWGWQGAFFAALDGVLYCLLNGAGWQSYLCYGIGNLSIMSVLLMTRFMGKQKIAGKWHFSALFVVVGWISVVLGRTLIATCCGDYFVAALLKQVSDLFTLAIALIIILVLRRLDGMFEDQKHYLLRLDDERKEIARRDTYGDEPIEIDEESLSILKRKDDDEY